MPLHIQRWLRRSSWVLMGIAVLIVGYVGTLVGYESYAQHNLLSAWDTSHAGVNDAQQVGNSVFVTRHPHLTDGEPMAKLSVPRINFTAVVTEGADRGVLTAGPGHDNHTDYPGEGGLILIGNHNGFSTSWSDVHTGDIVGVDTTYGRFHYRITQRYITSGTDRSYIDHPRSGTGEVLELVTCWPLWQGAFAPDRLVFEATPVNVQ
ncbi:MAG: sortase [Chloroflexota bacterium]|jgi:LPXTG-site transpeptidase (sortase) family protein|nr:sortase [Chloroflexota bacterium]